MTEGQELTIRGLLMQNMEQLGNLRRLVLHRREQLGIPVAGVAVAIDKGVPPEPHAPEPGEEPIKIVQAIKRELLGQHAEMEEISRHLDEVGAMITQILENL